jgi:Dehydrogenases with different specificities (related to short-chain alcohol dehydrogenases)
MDLQIVLWFLRIVLEFLWTILLVLYYTLRSFIEFFYVPPKDLSGEIVVLTGAAGGFGSLLAEKLSKKGES